MSNVQEGTTIERDIEFLDAVVTALAASGVIAADSNTEGAEYADMMGMVANVQLPDGRWASIMVEVD